MIKVLFEVVKYIFAGMGIGFQGFETAFSSLSGFSDLKLRIYSFLTGIPFQILTAISFIITIVTLSIKIIKRFKL